MKCYIQRCADVEIAGSPHGHLTAVYVPCCCSWYNHRMTQHSCFSWTHWIHILSCVYCLHSRARVTACSCSEKWSLRSYELKRCFGLVFVRLYVNICVCVYQTINVPSLTSDAGCWGMLLCCQNGLLYTLSQTSLSRTHSHIGGVCGGGKGDTCVTVKLQDICLGNLGAMAAHTQPCLATALSFWAVLKHFLWAVHVNPMS